MITRERRRHAPRRCLAALGALAVVAAGCGDDSDDGDSDPTEEAAPDATTTTSEDETTGTSVVRTMSLDEVVAEYQDCMADEGADIQAEGAPTIEMLASARDMPPELVPELNIPDTYLDAHAACGEAVAVVLAAGGSQPDDAGPPTTVNAELARQMYAAVECLNNRGWDFLEPGVETGPLVMAPRDPDFDWDTPGALDDQFECQQEAGMIPAGEFTPAPPPGGN
jgi:hypothetical protein